MIARADVFSASEKLECALREVRFRKYVYPRRVADNKMTQRQAEDEIKLMEAIAADYVEAANKERLL